LVDTVFTNNQNQVRVRPVSQRFGLAARPRIMDPAGRATVLVSHAGASLKMSLSSWGGRAVTRAAAVVVFLSVSAGARAQQAPRVMTLDQVVRLAVEQDPAAVAAEGALSAARADQLQQTGAWLPTVNLNSFYSNSSNQRFDQATGQLQSESYTAQLQGGVDLFTGGRRLLAQRTVRAQVAAADAQYESQRFATVLAATETFYDAAAAADLVAVAEQRMQRARDQLAAARTRLELGTSTQSDALRA
jgi:outer membrane protein TolC